MNKRISSLTVLLAAAALFIGCKEGNKAEASTAPDSVTKVSDTGVNNTENAESIPDASHQMQDPGMRALLESYPDFISDIKDNKIIFTDGSSMIYDDGKVKDFVTRLDNSDPEDMFFVKYQSQNAPEYLADAGRSRCEDLFKKMYGSSSAAVQKKLVSVPWFGKNIKFTSANGASEQLKKVAAEIAQHPDLRKYVDCSGTFYWRPVRGAKRLSAHSYGIAIDIAVSNSDYWLWKNPGASETKKITYANRIPKKLVEIFERHGFVWGGAWYHFDTMHFEYRPEILAFAKYSK